MKIFLVTIQHIAYEMVLDNSFDTSVEKYSQVLHFEYTPFQQYPHSLGCIQNSAAWSKGILGDRAHRAMKRKMFSLGKLF